MGYRILSDHKEACMQALIATHSHPQRLHSFCSAPRIVTSGKVQHGKSLVAIPGADQKEHDLWG